MNILLIEDETKVSSFIKKGLEEQAMSVHAVGDGRQGVEEALTGRYDMIILDIMLPELNGIEVCSLLRKQGVETPVLMLTALSSTQDKVKGLDSGADDYLTKPFHFQELLARIRAIMRRKNGGKPDTNKLTLDNLSVDLDTKEVFRGGNPVTLTAREFRLLVLLLKNKGRVVSRVDITEQIWEQSFDHGSNVIDVYINYLRKKIDRENERKLIHTVIGMGYVMRIQDDS